MDWRGLNNLQPMTSGSQRRHAQLQLPVSESPASESLGNGLTPQEGFVTDTTMVGLPPSRQVPNTTKASLRAIGSERNTHRPRLAVNAPHLEPQQPESMVTVSTRLLNNVEYHRQTIMAQEQLLEHCTSHLQRASSVLTRAMESLSTTADLDVVDGIILTEDRRRLHAIVSVVCGVAREHEQLFELLKMARK